MSVRIGLATVAAALACAPAALAEQVTFGSSLEAKATTAVSHSRDWAAFPTRTEAKGSYYRAPATGEVTEVKFKGTVLKPTNDAAYGGRYPGFVFHILVLHPEDNGRFTATVATEDLPFPFGGDPQQITTFRLQRYASRMCVQKGDVVSLATSGGFGNSTPQYGSFPDEFYAKGYPVRMFARSKGAGTRMFKQPPGLDWLQGGDSEVFGQHEGTELLMRTTIGTGRDARWTCRTKAQRENNWPNPGV